MTRDPFLAVNHSNQWIGLNLTRHRKQISSSSVDCQEGVITPRVALHQKQTVNPTAARRDREAFAHDWERSWFN